MQVEAQSSSSASPQKRATSTPPDEDSLLITACRSSAGSSSCASLDNTAGCLDSRLQSASAKPMVAMPSAELPCAPADRRCQSVVALPECEQTGPGDHDRRASCPPRARRASIEVLENGQPQARMQRRSSVLTKLVTMAGERMAESLASWEENSQNRIERGLNPHALPSDELLYEQQDLRRSFGRNTPVCR